MKKIDASRETSSFESDAAKASLDKLLNNSVAGFLSIAERDRMWSDSARVSTTLRKKFSCMVNVGIGGSAVGTQAIFGALGSDKKFYFCDNVDQIEFDDLLAQLNADETVFLVTSKSGRTIETLMAIDLIVQKLQQLKVSWQEHVVVITEETTSPLYAWAQQNRLETLILPKDIGGRFSVLTPVGMLPAGFMGHDLEAFRSGARSALNSPNLIADFVASTMQSWKRDEWITMLWIYASSLRSFGFWFNQLWAESLAKAKDRAGNQAPRASTPLVAVGACDQHSLLQQVIEGAKDKWVLILEVLEAQQHGDKLIKSQFAEHRFLEGKSIGDLLHAECRATYEAITQADVSAELWQINKIDAFSLGQLFMFFQIVIATVGETMNINSFDQPGVELGKQLAKNKLAKANVPV